MGRATTAVNWGRHGRLPEEVTPVVLAAAGFAESGHGARSSRASTESGKDRRDEARRLARLLVAEIGLYEDEAAGVSERCVASEIKEELLGSPEPVAERIRVLERAQHEIAERLEEVVEHLKSDLVESTEGASR